MSTNNTTNLNEPFAGFSGPNYTQVPDALFDELLPKLSGTELKVLLYIMRRTFGFKRDEDTISLSQMLNGIVKRDGTRLDYGTGVSKKSLLAALRSLRERNILVSERRRSVDRGDEASLYRLNVVDKPTRGVKTPPGGGAKLHLGGGVTIPPGGEAQNYTTQETVEQETVEQKIDFEFSNIRKVQPAKTQESQPTEKPPTGARNDPATDAPSEPEAVRAVLLRRRQAIRPSTVRDEVLDEDYQRIQDYIADRAREFNDTASLKSSTTRAWNLFQRSGLPVEEFVSRIYQARSLTQESSARIMKKTQDPEYRVMRKSKMAYFFAVLEDHLSLSDKPRRARKRPEPPAPPPSRKGSDDEYRDFIKT